MNQLNQDVTEDKNQDAIEMALKLRAPRGPDERTPKPTAIVGKECKEYMREVKNVIEMVVSNLSAYEDHESPRWGGRKLHQIIKQYRQDWDSQSGMTVEEIALPTRMLAQFLMRLHDRAYNESGKTVTRNAILFVALLARLHLGLSILVKGQIDRLIEELHRDGTRRRARHRAITPVELVAITN